MTSPVFAPRTALALLLLVASACASARPPFRDPHAALQAPRPSDETHSAPRAAREPVRFEVSADSDFPALSVYVKTGTETVPYVAGVSLRRDVLTPVCDTPCSAVLRSRTYDLAIGAGVRAPVTAATPVRLRGGERVLVDYRSHTLLRATGWVILIAGVLGGMWLVTDALPLDGSTDTRQVITGSIITGASLIGGLVLANQRDRVRLSVSR